ncbi:MAG: hypothetical protein ACOYK8_03525 [Alphaproteobacteria bacterium]
MAVHGNEKLTTTLSFNIAALSAEDLIDTLLANADIVAKSANQRMGGVIGPGSPKEQAKNILQVCVNQFATLWSAGALAKNPTLARNFDKTSNIPAANEIFKALSALPSDVDITTIAQAVAGITGPNTPLITNPLSGQILKKERSMSL